MKRFLFVSTLFIAFGAFSSARADLVTAGSACLHDNVSNVHYWCMFMASETEEECMNIAETNGGSYAQANGSAIIYDINLGVSYKCESDGWTRIQCNQGYEEYSSSRDVYVIYHGYDCSQRYVTNSYRCAAAYYGDGNNCSLCPEFTDAAGKTVRGVTDGWGTATTQNDCSLPVDTYTSDIGKYTVVEWECKY